MKHKDIGDSDEKDVSIHDDAVVKFASVMEEDLTQARAFRNFQRVYLNENSTIRDLFAAVDVDE